MTTYAEWMTEPLRQAQQCLEHDDVPVGAAVFAHDGRQIGVGRNIRELAQDPTGHAEVVALRAASQSLGTWRLDGCTLVVTLEPCVMCAGALIQSRVERVVFGAWDDKAGACGSVWDLVRDRASLHRLEVVPGVRESECGAVLTEFFRTRRDGESAQSQ